MSQIKIVQDAKCSAGQLFALLGQEVPQGVMGTNPQQMSAEPALTTVQRGFGTRD